MAGAVRQGRGAKPKDRGLTFVRGDGQKTMPDAIQEAKRALRVQARAELQRISQAARLRASEQVREALRKQAVWTAARSVLFFAPLPLEVDVWPLVAEALSAGKSVALPRFAPESGHYEACQIRDPGLDLQPGRFGIREPVNRCARLSSNRLDLILVPGLAFDLQGRRLGRGKGYYDRLLKELHGVFCGVAYDEQILEAIPSLAHDARMDFILTPTRWIQIERR